MKFSNLKFLAILTLAFLTIQLKAQSVTELISGYTGIAEWDAAKKNYDFCNQWANYFCLKRK